LYEAWPEISMMRRNEPIRLFDDDLLHRHSSMRSERRLATEAALPTNRIPNDFDVNRGSLALTKVNRQDEALVLLVVVAVWMAAMPVPGGLDDSLDVSVLGLPLK